MYVVVVVNLPSWHDGERSFGCVLNLYIERSLKELIFCQPLRQLLQNFSPRYRKITYLWDYGWKTIV